MSGLCAFLLRFRHPARQNESSGSRSRGVEKINCHTDASPAHKPSDSVSYHIADRKEALMISQQMAAKLNEQIKNEWESQFLYLTMMAWCLNNNYDGFAAWFRKQADEEGQHGFKILGHLNDVGANVIIPSLG